MKNNNTYSLFYEKFNNLLRFYFLRNKIIKMYFLKNKHKFHQTTQPSKLKNKHPNPKDKDEFLKSLSFYFYPSKHNQKKEKILPKYQAPLKNDIFHQIQGQLRKLNEEHL